MQTDTERVPAPRYAGPDGIAGTADDVLAQTLLSGGLTGTGGFSYFYSLGVGTNATAGAYSGTVTFTASN